MKLFLILSGGINSLLTVRYDLNCVDNTPFFLIVNVLHLSSQTIIFAHLHHFAKRFCTLFGWQGLNHTQTRTNLEVLMSCKIYTPYNGFFQQTTNFLFFFWYASSRSTYYTILEDLQDSHRGENNKNCKNYLQRGSCTPCRKMTHKENLQKSQNQF